jgi:hypothetical protein
MKIIWFVNMMERCLRKKVYTVLFDMIMLTTLYIKNEFCLFFLTYFYPF